MHPTDHISTAFEYFVDPSNIYGARYHRVATYYVNIGVSSYFTTNDLANPKSAIFTLH